MSTCCVLPVGSGLHGAEAIARVVDSFRPALAGAGASVVDDVAAADPAVPLAVLVVTGGTERAILAAWSARQQLVAGEPLLLLAHGDHNSMPAALEALARLHQDGARGRIARLGVGTPSATSELADAVHDVTVWHALHRTRIGQVGEPSDWLVASVPPADAVASRWGPTLVPVDIGPAIDRMVTEAGSPGAVSVQLGARHSHGPGVADVGAAARFEPVLRHLATEHALDAVSVRCFDLLAAAHTSGCVALSVLNDAGLVAGCEGDVVSTVAMVWVKHLLGRVAWMANPADVDAAAGVLELAHCTIARSLVAAYDLDTHFESGLGVGIAGEIPPGPVTLVRLGGPELDALWCVDGEALPTTPRPGRCRTQLDVRIDPDRAADLLERPLGNHLVVVAGHHAERLRSWWRRMIAPIGRG